MATDKAFISRALASAQARVQACLLEISSYAEADEALDGYDREEYLQNASASLTSATKNAFSAARIVLELLQLDETLASMKAEYEDLWPKLGVVEYFDEYLGPYNDVVEMIRSMLDLLVPLVGASSEVEQQRRILTSMLRQVGHYIERTNKLPSKEKDVQDHLEDIVRLAFPDVIREAAVSKQTKTYFPDFGIESIETAVEVKFVNVASKASLALGGLYEDMKGYAGSQYTDFIGIIYMTGNFVTQQQVNAELKKVGTPKNWRVYLVVGNGAPKPIKPKAAK